MRKIPNLYRKYPCLFQVINYKQCSSKIVRSQQQGSYKQTFFPSYCVDSQCKKEGKGSCLRRQTAFYPVYAQGVDSLCRNEEKSPGLRRQIAFFPVYALTPYVGKERKGHACGAKQHFSKKRIRDPGSLPDPTGSIVTDVRTDNKRLK